MPLKPNTNIKSPLEEGITNILAGPVNKVPESAKDVDDISVYPAHSEISGCNRRISPSNFLAMMSHDLRAYLNGVVGLTRLLFNTNLTSEQRNYIGNI